MPPAAARLPSQLPHLSRPVRRYVLDSNGLIARIEGESIFPVLQGRRWSRQQHLFFEHEGNRAVRHDPWKLVSELGREWELYNLEADRTETVDLSGKNMPKVAELRRMYEEWA